MAGSLVSPSNWTSAVAAFRQLNSPSAHAAYYPKMLAADSRNPRCELSASASAPVFIRFLGDGFAKVTIFRGVTHKLKLVPTMTTMLTLELQGKGKRWYGERTQ